MPTNTTTYSLQKPTVGGDEDAWGGYINANLDKVDDLLTNDSKSKDFFSYIESFLRN